jgi:SH3 domain-containing protein/zinc ribbon protein
MSDSLIGSANKKSGSEYCPQCREPIPEGSVFCSHCGPPDLHEEEVDTGMGGGQTFFRILLIVALFGAIAIFKLDLNLWDTGEMSAPDGAVMQSSDGTKTEKPHVVDFKTIHHIKADQSQMRKKPADDGKVLTVLKKGAKVTILDSNDDWWKITGDGQTGWIAKDDLDTQIQ